MCDIIININTEILAATWSASVEPASFPKWSGWLHTQHGRFRLWSTHCSDVIMGSMASQITSLTIVYPTVYSGADQRKHQSSALLAFVWEIHRWPVKRKMCPFDEVIMITLIKFVNVHFNVSWYSTYGLYVTDIQHLWRSVWVACGIRPVTKKTLFKFFTYIFKRHI